MSSFPYRPLRDMNAFRASTCDGRPLLQSVMHPEVADVLEEWINSAARSAGVLIGGLAVSYYVRPFVTDDIDVLYLTADEIPDAVFGLYRLGERSFKHHQYSVSVDTFTVASFAGNLSKELCGQIISTAIEDSGMRIASREGLIAMKLNRRTFRDLADVVNILISYPNTSLIGWPLFQEQLALLEDLRTRAI